MSVREFERNWLTEVIFDRQRLYVYVLTSKQYPFKIIQRGVEFLWGQKKQ